MASLLIDTILRERKITDYLASKHIYADGGEHNGKLNYHCPLHEGDNTPSFVVYLNSGNYQNFYCFGCKSRYNIIHLYQQLEKVSAKVAIQALANGIVPTDEASLNYAVTQAASDNSVAAKFTPDELTLPIAVQLHDFLQIVNNDPDCMKAVDKIYQVVDECLDKCDIEGLYNIYTYLPDQIIRRIALYNEQQEKKLLQGLL